MSTVWRSLEDSFRGLGLLGFSCLSRAEISVDGFSVGPLIAWALYNPQTIVLESFATGAGLHIGVSQLRCFIECLL